MDLGEVNYYFVDVHLSKLSKGIMSKEAARAMEIELHIQGCIKCFTAFEWYPEIVSYLHHQRLSYIYNKHKSDDNIFFVI